jgi:O-antigen ligase
MNPTCPECRLRFDREHGYFTGAMYVSYALGIPLIALFTFLAWLVRRDWPIGQLVLAAWLAFLPLVPLVFRYSRILWIYFDRAIDPEPPEKP